MRYDGKFGFIDKEGREALPFLYDDGATFSEGMCAVNVGIVWAYINREGKQMMNFKYTHAYPYKEGRARVRFGKWGFLDKNGKEIIPLTYEAAEDFNDGRARVKKDGEWFYIDYNGNRIE